MKVLIIPIVILLLIPLAPIQTLAQEVNSPNGFGIVIYQMGGQYFAKDSQNNIIISNDAPDIVIKSALQKGGDIYISGGTYYLSKGFSGFDLQYGTHLKLAPNASLVIPSSYNGYVFRFGNYVGHCVLDGGHIYEATPVKRQWTGIMMQGGPGGVYFNYIENTVITDPGIAIDFNATTGQWANANTFVNIKVWNFVKGIEFDFKGTHTDGKDGFDGNTFRDSQFQGGPMTTYGVKDVKNQFNAFYNVQFWDLPSSSISATIDSLAENTVIVGGQMTYQNFVDKGRNTMILDAWHNNISKNSTLNSILLNATYQPIHNTPTLPLDQVMNMSIIQQASGDFVKGNHGQLIVPYGQSATVTIYGMVDDPNGGYVHMSVSRPDGIVEQVEADVTSAGAFYYPLIFDRNSLTGQYKIHGSYEDTNLGTLFLNVTDSSTQPITSNQRIGLTENNSISLEQIKNNARSWSQGKTNDDIFLNNIQYLAGLGMITIPAPSQSLDYSTIIPAWFKNDAGWWADDQITDKDFFAGLQYLLNSGIISLH